MEGVRSGFFEQFGGFDGFGEAGAAFLAVFCAGDADQDGQFVPHACLDGGDDFAGQAGAVGEGSAVGVGALVVPLVQEDAKDVAVLGVDLDRVGTRLGDAFGGVGLGLDEPVDVLLGHLLVRGLLAGGGGAHLAELFPGAVGQGGHVVAVVWLVRR